VVPMANSSFVSCATSVDVYWRGQQKVQQTLLYYSITYRCWLFLEQS